MVKRAYLFMFPGAVLRQVMAVLSEAVLHGHRGELKLQGLHAWLVFIRCLARRAPDLLQRVVVQAAVVLLPVLEEGGDGMQVIGI